MGCESNVSPYRITAANVYWGRKNKFCVDTDSNLSLAGGEHFLFSTKTTEYYAWIDLDGASVDPAVSGRTGIELELITGYTASDLADELKLKLEAIDGVFVTISNNGTCGCVELNELGAVLSAAADVDTGLTISTTEVGVGGFLGKTDGGVAFTKESSEIEILSDQNGATPEDIVISGTTISVSTNLLEMSKEKWQLLVGEVGGSNYTPSGGTEVTGYGTGRNFQSLFDLAGCLVLEPIDRPNRDEDFLFFKAIPSAGALTFSGTEVLSMEVEFRCLNDDSKVDDVNIMVYGDVSQDFRKV